MSRPLLYLCVLLLVLLAIPGVDCGFGKIGKAIKRAAAGLVKDAVKTATGINVGGKNGYGSPYYLCWANCDSISGNKDQCKKACNSLRQ